MTGLGDTKISMLHSSWEKKTPPLNYHKLCIHNVTSTETNKKVIPSFRHTHEFDNSNEMEQFLKKQTSVVHLI